MNSSPIEQPVNQTQEKPPIPEKSPFLLPGALNGNRKESEVVFRREPPTPKEPYPAGPQQGPQAPQRGPYHEPAKDPPYRAPEMGHASAYNDGVYYDINELNVKVSPLSS